MSTSREYVAAITAVADYSPGPPVTNAELETVLQAPVATLMRYFGVESRHYVIDPRTGQLRERDLGTTEMSARAAEKAVAAAGIRLAEVDCLICGTSTPDDRLPPLTYAVQRRLGLSTVTMYDLRGGCAVSLQALTLATALIEAGRASTVLITAADTISPAFFVPLLGAPKPSTEAVMNGLAFADGGAAMVVQRAAGDREAFSVRMVNGRSRFPHYPVGFALDAAGIPTHNHRAIREVLPEVVTAAVNEVLAPLDGDAKRLDRLVVPQANRSMVDMVRTESLRDKMFYVGHRIGNSPAPAIMRAIALGMDAGEIVPGKTSLGIVAIESASWCYGVSLLH